MRSLWQGVLAAAFLCKGGEGGMLETRTLTGVAPERLQQNAGYAKFPHQLDQLTETYPVEYEPRYNDSTLPYFQEEPTAYTAKQPNAPLREAGVKPTEEQRTDVVLESSQVVQPAFPLQHVGGIKTLLVSALIFFLCLVGAVHTTDASLVGSERGSMRGADQKAGLVFGEVLFALIGIGTALLVYGLVELLRSLHNISRGNLPTNSSPRVRGLLPYLIILGLSGMGLSSWMKRMGILDYVYGLGAGCLFLFIATTIQLVEYKLKHGNILVRNSVPSASASATPSATSAPAPLL